jgi:DNA polymerase epsilon subunit 1
MKHTLIAEMGVKLDEITDFDDVCDQVKSKIDELIQHHQRHENPKIYHLDVGAMYPNIILTNRLQPPAVVTDEQCLACIHNTPDAKCKREMSWRHRAEVVAATRGEYERIRVGTITVFVENSCFSTDLKKSSLASLPERLIS